ncbi:MAG TPA: hypothetical protein VGN97_14755 [Mesorhizobium sp.]|jgi:hypothetical protein|nr:hypothetical protein [Mesorhizobium sp.]
MKNKIKNIALAGLVALGAFAAAPAAHAGDVKVVIGLSIGADGHRDWRHARACTPERALHKAQRLGFRRVSLDAVKRNRIIVNGRRNGERQEVVFARRANCPVIRIR